MAAKKVAQAIKAGPAPAVEAIKSHGAIADPVVTQALGKALRHRDVDVKAAAIQALRFNEDASALSELLKVRKVKDVCAHAVLGPEYYLALGQRHNLKAFPTVAANLAPVRRKDPIIRARVLSLGRLRTTASIETLIRYAARGGRFKSEARMSLAALTGADLGKGPRDWGAWWKENSRGFKFSAQEGPLPLKNMAREWGRIWSESSGDKKEPRKKDQRDAAADGEGDEQDNKNKKDVKKGSKKLRFRKRVKKKKRV